MIIARTERKKEKCEKRLKSNGIKIFQHHVNFHFLLHRNRNRNLLYIEEGGKLNFEVNKQETKLDFSKRMWKICSVVFIFNTKLIE